MSHRTSLSLRALPLVIAAFAVLGADPLPYSEVYQRLYNPTHPGELMDAEDPTLQPGYDRDGSNSSNAFEYAAGTDLADSASELRPVFLVHPENSGLFSLRFDTVAGKKYVVTMSDSLEPDSWVEVGEGFVGTNYEVQMAFDVRAEDGSVPPREFFRVTVSDLPAVAGAGTGATAYEQYVLSQHPGYTEGDGPVVPGVNTDGDSFDDEHDAAKDDQFLNFKKSPEMRYRYIPVDGGGMSAVDANDNGQILFRTNVNVTDYLTQPVGAVWDPRKPADQRLTKIFFKPMEWKLRIWQASGPPGPTFNDLPDSEDEIISSSITFPPVPDDDRHHTLLTVTVQSLGDDGSVMANVHHSLNDNYANNESPEKSITGNYVFLWPGGEGANYKECKVLGSERGYQNNIDRSTCNFAAGFYTGADGVHALVFDQDNLREPNNPVLPLTALGIKSYLLAHGQAGDATDLPGEPSRRQDDLLADTSALQVTRTGRVIFKNRTATNGFGYTVGGVGGRHPVPPATVWDGQYDFITDLPEADRWALSYSKESLKIWKGINPAAPFDDDAQAEGIIQFDQLGTGIGDGDKGDAIWRNGRWLTYVDVCGLFPIDGLPAPGLYPQKISPGGCIWLSGGFRSSNGILIPALIAPGEKMAGVLGDKIPSGKKNSIIDHFVTPSKDGDYKQPYVELIAAGISAAHFSEMFEWVGGEAGSAANQRKVSRDKPEMTPVKIVLKNGGPTIAEMWVWVVWSTVTARDVSAVFEPRLAADPEGGPDPIQVGSQYYIPDNDRDGRRFIFNILPASIIDKNGEHPLLEGVIRRPVPGKGLHAFFPIPCDNAQYQWDVSRKVRISVSNPNLISKADLMSSLKPSVLVNQPKKNDVPVDFPSNPVEGNDDPLIGDEDDNPYQEFNEKKVLMHAKGELSSYDAPGMVLDSTAGANNQSMKIIYDFKEFARLELWDGERDKNKTDAIFWFRISPFKDWHHAMRSKFTDPPAQWIDSGSTSATGLSGPFIIGPIGF